MSFAMSTANYVVDKWSGYTRRGEPDPIAVHAARAGAGLSVSYHSNWPDPVSAIGSWHVLPTSLVR